MPLVLRSVSGLPDHQDAYGHMVWDHLQGADTREVIEREDGYIDVSMGAKAYFAPVRRWFRHERTAIRQARGRVLDVGAGAGRVALYLQERGHDVVAADISPLAIETCTARGVRDARVLAATELSRNTVGDVDTIVMFGNNFGLFADERRARWLLGRFAAMTGPDGRILATTRDVYGTDNPDHLRYIRANKRRGRMGGQIRLRVRYRTYTTPWFDYLMVSRAELERILRPTRWRLERTIDEEGPEYVAVIGKEPAA